MRSFLQFEWRFGRSESWPGRLEAVRILLLLGLLAGLLISWKLWLTGRAFPHLPVFAGFGPPPEPWDQFQLGLYLLVLAATLIRPNCRWALGSLMGLSVVLALQDQVRWQPWFYLYLLALGGFLFLPGRSWEGIGQAVLGLVRLLLVAMYFWSGFHKLDPAFDTLFRMSFIEPLGEKWPDWAMLLLHGAGPTAPWLEMVTAFLLLLPVPVLRHAGVVLAVGSHLFILALVGPLGMDNNAVIWPWNLCMAAVVVLAFWRIPWFGWRELVVTPVRFWALPLLVLVGVLPAFSPGAWDRYFSFHLYSGRDQRILLVLNDRAVEALPPELRPYLEPGHGNGLRELRFQQWALKELKAPYPCEERHNLAIGKQFAALPYQPGAMVFIYFDYEFQLAERGWDKFSPGEMLQLEKFPEPRRKYQAP